jgi:hypothetical protein
MLAGQLWACDEIAHLCSAMAVTLATTIKPSFSIAVMLSAWKKSHPLRYTTGNDHNQYDDVRKRKNVTTYNYDSNETNIGDPKMKAVRKIFKWM